MRWKKELWRIGFFTSHHIFEISLTSLPAGKGPDRVRREALTFKKRHLDQSKGSVIDIIFLWACRPSLLLFQVVLSLLERQTIESLVLKAQTMLFFNDFLYVLIYFETWFWEINFINLNMKTAMLNWLWYLLSFNTLFFSWKFVNMHMLCLLLLL